MKLSRSYITAFASITLIIGWFLLNSLKSQKVESQPSETISTEQVPTVLVKNSYASDHEVNYKIFGRTEANRVVTLKAETSGLVVLTPTREGQILGKGQIVCRLQTDARKANLDQANALLELRRFDLETTEALVEKGFKSEIQLKSQKAQVDVASANVKQSQIELDNVNIRNQFKGILLKQIAETGDYLLPGTIVRYSC
jgi:multidrug efflux system membrane fusion protein